MARETMFLKCSALAAILLCAAPAQAEMSCATYVRGAAAQDDYVLREAVTIATRLIESGWRSPAMETDAKDLPASKDLGQRLLLRQLSRYCRALPRESIDKLVSVHLRATPPR